MGLGTILGYAAGGIAVMVAAPILAPVGALTLAGAALGAGAGALAGVVKSEMDSEEETQKDKRFSDTEKKIKEVSAKISAQELRFAEEMKHLAGRFADQRKYEDFIIAQFAMAVAVAKCDGEISQIEKDEIEGYIAGISASAFPDRIKSAISDLYESPPSFNTAILLLEKVDKEHWHHIDDMIRLIMEADGVTHKNEKAFLLAWESVRAA